MQHIVQCSHTLFLYILLRLRAYEAHFSNICFTWTRPLTHFVHMSEMFLFPCCCTVFVYFISLMIFAMFHRFFFFFFCFSHFIALMCAHMIYGKRCQFTLVAHTHSEIQSYCGSDSMASRLFLTRTFKLIIGFFASMTGFRGLHVLRRNVSAAAAAAADSGHLLLLCLRTVMWCTLFFSL